MMGKAPVLSEKIFLVGWKDTNALFVFSMEDGWLDRDLNLFGGTGIFVLLIEVIQGSID